MCKTCISKWDRICLFLCQQINLSHTLPGPITFPLPNPILPSLTPSYLSTLTYLLQWMVEEPIMHACCVQHPCSTLQSMLSESIFSPGIAGGTLFPPMLKPNMFGLLGNEIVDSLLLEFSYCYTTVNLQVES